MPAELRPDDEAELAADAETVIAERRPEASNARRLAPEEIGFAIRPVRPPIGDRLSRGAGVVAVLIMLAVLKPWAPATGEGPTAGPRAMTGPTTSPVPLPEPTPDSPEGLAGPICLGAGAWRIASLETWRDQDVRVWRAIEPLADASGPLDPEIPTVPVAGLEVSALGWCAPAYGPERPAGPALVEGWIVIDDAAHHVDLRQVLPSSGTTHLAALYVPVGRCGLGATCAPTASGAPVPQRWETGRVIFRYDDLGTMTSRWLGADVELYVPAGGSRGDDAPSSTG